MLIISCKDFVHMVKMLHYIPITRYFRNKIKSESVCNVSSMTCKMFSSLHNRFYTRFFGRHGDASKALCCHALMRYPEWESKIDAWQKPILENE